MNVLAGNNTPQTVSILTTPLGQNSGNQAHFRVLYQDHDGYDDIDSMILYFSRYDGLPGVKCYTFIDPQVEVVYLRNAAVVTAWADSGSLGENATISNGECDINLQASSLVPFAPAGSPPPIKHAELGLRFSLFRPVMLGSHFVQSFVTDRSLTQGPTAPITWTVPAGDTTAPLITAAPSWWVGGNSAVLKWTTDELSTTVVEYGLSSYGSSSVSSSLVLSHAVALTGLIPNSLYSYRVKSVDAANNPSLYATGTFTTGLASAQPITISNTGVSAVGAPLAAGAADTDYTLVQSVEPGTTGLPARVVNDGWPVALGSITQQHPSGSLPRRFSPQLQHQEVGINTRQPSAWPVRYRNRPCCVAGLPRTIW